MIDRVKTEEWEEIFAKCKTNKGPMSKVYIQKFCKAKLFLSICRNFGRKQTKNITKEFTGKETKSLNSI